MLDKVCKQNDKQGLSCDWDLQKAIEATPEAYRLKGTFRAAARKGPGWPHPVIHQGKLYLRDKDVLMCYDVRRP